MTLSGNPLDYLIVFLSGIVISFTPCVYPLIPISVGFIGVTAAGSRIKGLTLSLVYVTGIAITYSLLGLIASLTGKIFGAVSTHPLTNILAGLVIIVFGLFMLDIPGLSLPSFMKMPTVKNKGHLSAFMLGLSSGLIVSPCVTPALGAILAYLITRKNILYGMTLLLTFSYGMGFLLIICGAFSSILLTLPKSGKWMVYLKRIAAFILIGMGIYFLTVGIRRF
jgi:thiol:disulfide interchange protein DsbD